MAENETKEVSTKENQNKPFPFSLNFPTFHIHFPQFPQFPQFKNETKQPSPQATITGEEIKAPKPDVVKVPDVRKEFPSLKLEAEGQEESGPQNMWQVYALGGFMIARWIWGRWKDRQQANNSDKQSGEDGDTTIDD